MTCPEYEAMPPIGYRTISYWRGHGILGVYSTTSVILVKKIQIYTFLDAGNSQESIGSDNFYI